MNRQVSRWVSFGMVGSLILAGCASTNNSLTSRSKGSFLRPWKNRSQPVAVAEVPSLPNALQNPAKLNLTYAQLMEQGGRLPIAKSHYQKVLEIDSQNTEAIVGLARIHQHDGDSEAAEKELHRALQLAPNSATALQSLAQIHTSRNDWETAAVCLNQALQTAPENKSIRYELAVALVHTGHIEEALPHFIRTVGHAEAHYNVALILKDQGNLVNSEQQLRLALSKKPDFSAAHYWLQAITQESGHALPQHGSRLHVSAHTPGNAPSENIAENRSILPAGHSRNSW